MQAILIFPEKPLENNLVKVWNSTELFGANERLKI